MPKISNGIEKYKEGKKDGVEIEYTRGSFIFEPVKGEKINVVSWVRYPSYDFIFGYPDKTNPKSEKEVAFFQFRDTRAKKIKAGFYLDETELNEMVDGFSLIKKYVERIPRRAKIKKSKKVAGQDRSNSGVEEK